MFRLALAFPWQWGAGTGGSAPPVVTLGPYWVHEMHVRPLRVIPVIVRMPPVEPGRTWSEDPTLDTFKLGDG